MFRKLLLIFIALGFHAHIYSADYESNNEWRLKQLEQICGDMSKPIIFNFTFIFYSNTGAIQSQTELEKYGYKLSVEPHWEGGGWFGLIQASLTPNLSTLNNMSEIFHNTALHNNGEYDGWSAGCK